MTTKDTSRKDAILARKQALIAALGIGAMETEYDAALADLDMRLAVRLDEQSQVSAAKQHIEEVKAMVYLNGAIDGKNEAQRAAQLTLALRDDPDYQAAKASLDAAETALEVNTQQIETARRRMDAIKIKLRLAAANLELLAS